VGEIASIIGLLLIFTLIGGFFAAAEVSLVAMRESQVAALTETAGRRGRRLAALTSDPNRYLAAVQIGVTLAGFVSAGFGASRIVPLVSPTLQGWGLSSGLSDTLAFIAVTLLIAYLSLVLGELVPKRLALQRVQTVALFSAPVIDFTASIARPFIWLLSASTNVVVRLLGGNPEANREEITGEELRGIVASQESLTEAEREVIDEVFVSGRRELSEVMIPRTEVEFLASDLSVAAAADIAATMPHSRYPVIGRDADDVVGFVHVRDLFALRGTDPAVGLGAVARPVLRFPDSKQLIPTLHEMRVGRSHLAIVMDEYGGTAGIVTLEDLVEELIGEIEDEYDRPTPARLSDGTEVAGLLHLDEFRERTGVQLPEGSYETVGGYVMGTLGRLAVLGDTVAAPGAQLRVTELDGRRVAQVQVSYDESHEQHLPTEAAGEQPGA